MGLCSVRNGFRDGDDGLTALKTQFGAEVTASVSH